MESVRKDRDKISLEYQKMVERTMMETDSKFLTVDMLNKERGEDTVERLLDLTNMQQGREEKVAFRPQKKFLEERDLEIKRLSKIVIFLNKKN